MTKRTDTLDPQQLLKEITSPDAWLAKSVSLRRCGNFIWDAFVQSMTDYGRAARERDAGDQRKLDEVLDYLFTAKMLYGLALEAAFKGHLLRVKPNAIQVQLIVDGTGKVVEAEVKQLGVSLGQGHDLVRLAEQVGAFAKDASVGIDPASLRDLLQDLTECVMWMARYPAPVRSAKEFSLPGTPIPLFTRHLRDWLDPMTSKRT